MWACINLRETPGGSRHVADQLSELGVRHAATHSVEASRYCGQKLLVPLVIPVMQKALPALRGRSCLRPGSHCPIMALIGPSDLEVGLL
jgi:hypothetical protein